MLADSGAHVLFVHHDLLPQIASGIPANVKVILADESGDTSPWSTFGVGAPPAPAYTGPPRGMVPYTSGTTGKPKGVRRLPAKPEQRPHGRGADEHGVRRHPASRVLLSAPVYHSAPMSYLMNACAHGAELVLESSFDAKRTLQLIEQHRITHAYLVPTMYQRLLRHPRRGRRAVRHLVHRAGGFHRLAVCARRQARDDRVVGPGDHRGLRVQRDRLPHLRRLDHLARTPRHRGPPGQRRGPAILDDDGRELPTGQTGLIYGRQPAYPDFTYINNDGARQVPRTRRPLHARRHGLRRRRRLPVHQRPQVRHGDLGRREHLPGRDRVGAADLCPA